MEIKTTLPGGENILLQGGSLSKQSCEVVVNKENDKEKRFHDYFKFIKGPIMDKCSCGITFEVDGFYAVNDGYKFIRCPHCNEEYEIEIEFFS